MKIIFIFIVCISCCSLCCITPKVNAQTIQQLVFTELWQQQSGTPDTIEWSASCVDGSRNYIVVGNTLTATQMADVLITKYNSSGVLQWQATFNNSYDLQDYGIAVTTDHYNNIYVAATSFNDSTNDYDYNILMYDDAGSLQWQTDYNGADSKYDVPTAIALDDSGNIVVTGTSYSVADKFDFVTIKLDGSGNILWDAVYDYHSEADIPTSLLVLPTCRIIVTGGCGSSLFNWDIVAVRYDWAGSYVGASADTSVGYGFDHPTTLAKDNSGHIYITGAAMNSGNYDMVLIKLDSSLQEIWTQYFDYGNSLPDQGNDIQISSSGNIFITGYITRASGLKNGYLWGCDTSGTVFFHKEEATPDSIEAENFKLCIQPFGQILTAGWKDGTVDKDIYISAYDENGFATGYKENKGMYKGDDRPCALQCVIDTIYLTAKVADSDTTFTYMAVQYALDSILNVLSPNGDTTGSVSFWENRGQIIDTDDSIRHDIKFYTNEGPSLFFSDELYSYVLNRVDEDTTTDDTLVRIDVTYEQGNRFTKTNSLEKSSHDYLNYFLAHCPDGIVNVSGYKKLVTKNIYDGIDALYTWNKNNFNQRIICNPGSDPNIIILNFAGCDSVTIDTSGDLFVWTPIGIIDVPEPINYLEDIDGTITSLGWSTYFQLVTDTSVSFFIDTFDVSKSLVFEMNRDPSAAQTIDIGNLKWATFFDSNRYDYASDIKQSGTDIVVSGSAKKSIFPATATVNVIANFRTDNDIYIAKFDAARNLIWLTYYGGNNDDLHPELAIHYGGDIFFAGETLSSNLPTVNFNSNSQFYFPTITGAVDGFICRMNSTGTSLSWSTYIHGIGTVAEMSFEVAGAGGEYVHLVGTCYYSNEFPSLYSGNQYHSTEGSGFILSFNVLNCSELWGTVAGFDEVNGITFSHDNLNFFVVGNDKGAYGGLGVCTGYADFLQDPIPGNTNDYYQTTCNGYSDIIIAKFGILGNLVWGTYFGGGYNELGYGITSDYDDNIYVSGHVSSYIDGTTEITGATMMTLPNTLGGNYHNTSYNGHSAGFIEVFSTDCIPIWGTLLGGSDYGVGFTRVARLLDKIYAVGSTMSTDIDLLQYNNFFYSDIYIPSPSLFSSSDFFITMFNLQGDLEWATYYGSDGDDYFAYSRVYCSGSSLFIVGRSNQFTTVLLPLHDNGGYFSSTAYDYFGNANDITDGFIAEFDLNSIWNYSSDLLSNQNCFIAYPNPTNGLINLLNEGFEMGYEYFDLINNIGQKIGSYKLESSSVNSFNFDYLSQGFYLLRLVNNNSDKNLNLKIVIQ